jgi:transient receptor potential cation channel subfamily V protein 5
MVEKRGAVGETAFHVCFLMQSSTHLFCARRLLKWYPKLINDVYLSEEYYGAYENRIVQKYVFSNRVNSIHKGENVLHMSVVAEDPTMVKYLLDEGVDIHRRCYGNFFCPDDQRPTRGDSLEYEEVDVALRTNYKGYVAWGEYSLSFAAVLSQEECYRLILSRGADHDLCDSNGNSVTHIMVVFDNIVRYKTRHKFTFDDCTYFVL